MGKMIGISCILGLISRLVPGLRDLRPNSKCLNTLKEFMHSNYHIPTFFLAGAHHDFCTLYQKEADADIHLLSDLFANYITSDHHDDKRHDTLIPVFSQIGTSLNPDNPFIIRKVIKNSVHARNLVALYTYSCFLPPHDQQKELYEQVHDPKVLHEMYEFIHFVLLKKENEPFCLSNFM
jgi:hypothetical protein